MLWLELMLSCESVLDGDGGVLQANEESCCSRECVRVSSAVIDVGVESAERVSDTALTLMDELEESLVTDPV